MPALEKVVNITPTASGAGLREELEREAARRGKAIRPFIGAIYAFAVANPKRFAAPLKTSRSKPGLHIGATVDAATAKALETWSDEAQTSRGLLCCYILEKTLQDELLTRVFPGTEDN